MNFKIKYSLFLCAGLFLSANANTFAAPSTPAATKSAALATKTEWASGLKEPQGMAHYKGITYEPTDEILIADYGDGKILRYSHEGKLLGVLAKDLKGPSQIAVVTQTFWPAVGPRYKSNIFVSERKANRVIEVTEAGTVPQIGQSIEEPLGLVVGREKTRMAGNPRSAAGPRRETYRQLFVVSHTTSIIFRLDGFKWTPIFTPTEADRYGYRCLANDNGTLLLSDEEGGEVLMLSQSGRLSSWVKGIADPSGITIGPDGLTYVTDESEGGRLYRVNNLGEKTLVAEDLGRPRGVLFLDAKTALVSDRNGKVWKLILL